MANRRKRLAACALTFISCLLGGALRLSAQNSKSETIQQIGWEISTGNIRPALADAREAVLEYPRSAILMHLLAVAQSKDGLNAEARKSFNKSIELDPTIPQNYYDLALLDMQAGDYNDAIQMLHSFLGVSPQNARAHLMLGIAYRKQNNDPLALRELKQALTMSPNLPLAHYNLGRIYASQHNYKAALSEYRKELGVNPEFYGVYCSAGDAELAVKHPDSAEALFRAGAKLSPLAYQAYLGLARVYVAKKQFSKAENELQKVIVLAPGEIQAHSLLARVYNQLGKPLEAKREELVAETLKSQAKQAPATTSPSQ